MTNKEPDYYASNGLSPIGAFQQGLMSEEQYKGFLIGNVIKYVIRAGKKDDAIEDLEKAKHYIDFYLELLTTKKTGELLDTVDEIINTLEKLNNKLEEVN